jgi:RNA polymerase, sigma subunit, SigW
MAIQLVHVRRAPQEGTTNEPRDERRLAALAKAGDEDAFAELVRGRTDSVVAFLRRMLGDTEDARDVAQLTFLRVWENLPRYDPSYAFSTWLFRIAGTSRSTPSGRGGRGPGLSPRASAS